MSIQVEKHIEGIYIFKSTGELIYSKNYSDKRIDPAMVSGFFSAIQMFVENMLAENFKIQEISLHEQTFLFDIIDNGNIVIMAIIKEKSKETAKEILQRISKNLSRVLDKDLSMEGISNFLEIYITNMPVIKDDEIIKEKESKETDTGEDANSHLKPIKTKRAEVVKLKQEEHEIISLCDGEHTIKEISEKLNKPYFEVMQIILKFQREGLISSIKFF
ncbi:MAG: hypothetical protein ACTSQY_10070 [Candidatus Odinarchaeia archaeon]